jgi:hypothetical protein
MEENGLVNPALFMMVRSEIAQSRCRTGMRSRETSTHT